MGLLFVHMRHLYSGKKQQDQLSSTLSNRNYAIESKDYTWIGILIIFLFNVSYAIDTGV